MTFEKLKKVEDLQVQLKSTEEQLCGNYRTIMTKALNKIEAEYKYFMKLQGFQILEERTLSMNSSEKIDASYGSIKIILELPKSDRKNGSILRLTDVHSNRSWKLIVGYKENYKPSLPVSSGVDDEIIYLEKKIAESSQELANFNEPEVKIILTKENSDSIENITNPVKSEEFTSIKDILEKLF